MERYIIVKGAIFKRSGKIVRRYNHNGTFREMFRTVDGDEYPIEKTRGKLTEKQQKIYEAQELNAQLERLEMQKLIHPEDREVIDEWIAEAQNKRR